MKCDLVPVSLCFCLVLSLQFYRWLSESNELPVFSLLFLLSMDSWKKGARNGEHPSVFCGRHYSVTTSWVSFIFWYRGVRRSVLWLFASLPSDIRVFSFKPSKRGSYLPSDVPEDHFVGFIYLLVSWCQEVCPLVVRFSSFRYTGFLFQTFKTGKLFTV